MPDAIDPALPLVCVGMPIYNRAEGLKRTLACMRRQTYRNLRIIVSDNCSPNPEIPAFMQQAAREDPRIVYIRQPENIGLPNNFHFVLKEAVGDYFMWAADDDQWEPEFIEGCMARLLEDRSVGLAFTRFVRIDSNGRPDRDVIDMASYNRLSGWALVRRAIFDAEGFGRVNCMYGIWRLDIVREVMALPFDWEFPGVDHTMTLAAIARANFRADERVLFRKGGGTFDAVHNYTRIDTSIPTAEYSVRFRSHPALLYCSLVALSGTRYFAIGVLMLGIRFIREIGWDLELAVRKGAKKLGLLSTPSQSPQQLS